MQCTIGDFYNFCKENNIDLDKETINVKTRHGFKKIDAVDITARNSEKIKISTDNNKELIGSPKHQVCNSDDKWQYLKDLNTKSIVMTDEGESKINSIEFLPDKEDLYDLQVAGVKEYYTNNRKK